MKVFFSQYIQRLLKDLSIKVLKKFNPGIIAITGSNGKSSTKEAIACVLQGKFSVLSSPGNYNTEIGVPLAILERKIPRFFWLWPLTIVQCYLYSLFRRHYYQKVVLEMAADKPGDIKYLTSFIKPEVSVLTSIGPSHLELFKTIEAVAQEKRILLQRTRKNGFLCLNKDDPKVVKASQGLSQKIIWYGIGNKADVWASDIEQNLSGIKFNIHYQNDSLPIILYNVLGKHLIYPALAAVACGLIYKINLGKAIARLKTLKFPPGRMRIIEGIRESKIIDDSYNANPASMKSALSTLMDLDKQKVIKRRKIGVLGTMNELGDYERKGHEEVGEEAAKILDYLITVGKPANKYLAGRAIEKGLPTQNVFRFSRSVEAGQFLKKFIHDRDIILVKGSQNNVRTEWVVEQIMEHPEKAKDLLVRQNPPWKKPKELTMYN